MYHYKVIETTEIMEGNFNVKVTPPRSNFQIGTVLPCDIPSSPVVATIQSGTEFDIKGHR